MVESGAVLAGAVLADGLARMLYRMITDDGVAGRGCGMIVIGSGQ
jgi:hypothetical protein